MELEQSQRAAMAGEEDLDGCRDQLEVPSNDAVQYPGPYETRKQCPLEYFTHIVAGYTEIVQKR